MLPMFRTRVALRIAAGLAMLTVAILLMTATLGIGPNVNREILRRRSSLCETVAMSSSLLASRGDWTGLERNLREVVVRHPDLLSAAVRRADGRLLATVGDHQGFCKPKTAGVSTDTHWRVPVLAGNQDWGTVELRFTSLHDWRPSSWWRSPLVRQTAFVGLASCAAFYFYLKKVLCRFDPSHVIAARVRATLDTMATGLVILDHEERIVLANRAFATAVGREPDQLQGSRANALPWSVPPTGSPAMFPWSQVLRTGKTLSGSLLELNTGDDSSHAYLVKSAPIVGDDGICRGVLASFDEVPQLERIRAELQTMLDELHSSRDEVRRTNEELTLASG